MKKIITTFSSLAIIASFVLFASFSGNPNGHSSTYKFSSGKFSHTGSPLDGGQTCLFCHDLGNIYTDNSWISTNIPVTGYVAGQTYTISLTNAASPTNPHGFSITCENGLIATGTFVITDATNTQLSANHVTHTSAGTTPTTWSMNWTAPATGSGTATFYAAFVVDGYSGDVNTATASFNESTTGIADLANTASLNVYPNPASDVLNILLPAVNSNMVSVAIYSITGQKVVSEEVKITNNVFTKSYNISDLNTGIYFVSVKSNDRIFTQKFFVK